MGFSSQNLPQALECAFKFHLLQSSGGLLRIYTHKPSYKPGKVIKSVDKKERKKEISLLWQKFLLIIFKSNKLFDSNSKKKH